MHFLIFQLLAEETQTSISGQDSDIFEPGAYKSPAKSTIHLILTLTNVGFIIYSPRERVVEGNWDWRPAGVAGQWALSVIYWPL